MAAKVDVSRAVGAVKKAEVARCHDCRATGKEDIRVSLRLFPLPTGEKKSCGLGFL